MQTSSSSGIAEGIIDLVRIGIIQTDLDFRVAWKERRSDGHICMSIAEQDRAWTQIRLGLRQFAANEIKPDVVLLPELALPISRIRDITRLAKAVNCILIGGVDYSNSQAESGEHSVKNQGIVVVPKSRIAGVGKAYAAAVRLIGKTDPSHGEEMNLQRAGVKFESDPVIWRFESGRLGAFGVVICYDLLDLERVLLYRNRIQHLFVLAYNRDVTSFYHLAESLARTLFCNVVVCNTGYFGGSVVIAPYKNPWDRTIYRHEGSRLQSNQIFEIPGKALKLAQSQIDPEGLVIKGPEMKKLPPGFRRKSENDKRASNVKVGK